VGSGIRGDLDQDRDLLLALQVSEAEAAAAAAGDADADSAAAAAALAAEDEDDDDDDADQAAAAAAAGGRAARSRGRTVSVGVSFTEAQALADAMGGVTPELLEQLPPDVAAQLAAAAGIVAPATPSVPVPPQPPQAPLPPHQQRPRPPQFVVPQPQYMPYSPQHQQQGYPGSAYQQGLAPGAVVGDAAAHGQGASWVYLDTRDQPIGPVPESHMRALLYAGAFQPRTLVRSLSAANGLQPGSSAAVDAYGVPQVFLPLTTLFPDPMGAFVGDGRWVDAYRAATQYQSLLTHAITLGLPRVHVAPALLYMEANQIPAELGILLDVLGVTDMANVGPAGAGAYVPGVAQPAPVAAVTVATKVLAPAGSAAAAAGMVLSVSPVDALPAAATSPAPPAGQLGPAAAAEPALASVAMAAGGSA
jgi:hypothetical protein